MPPCSVIVPGSRSIASPRTRQVIATLVAIIVPLAAFSPALWNGFVWDDHFNFEMNRDYRGLGWTQLHWMFTNTLLSHWIPVTWLTLGIDYVAWGMNPAGYHLTNLLLHGTNAWLFALLAGRLIRLAAPATGPATTLTAATAASLFFSIHPLRVESVVWITERRDVLSGFFFLLAILAYLRSQDPERDKARRWLGLSVVFFQFGVLSKSIVVTLPVLLLILDIYPLRRLDAWPARWTDARNRRVILEKLPFLPMAVLGGIVATSVIGGRDEFTALTAWERLTAVVYSFWFYPWKTIVPVGLSPLYELPEDLDPREPQFLLAIAGVLGITMLVLALARRWPAGLAAWLSYLVIVGPVSGITHTGVQLVADRYSYLSCMPWALLFGGMVGAVIRAHRDGKAKHRFRVIGVGLAVWLIALAVLASRQTPLWRNSETLWKYAATADPRCFVCQHNVGTAYLRNGLTAEAIEHFEQAVALRPSAPFARGGLVFAYLEMGASEKAHHQLEALRLSDHELARQLNALFITSW